MIAQSRSKRTSNWVKLLNCRAKPKKVEETPDFFYYALAEGLRLMFARHGRWTRYAPDEPSPQLEFALDWG